MIDYDKKRAKKQTCVPTKIGGFVICCLLVAFLFGFGVMCVVQPDGETSTQENRALKQFPEISVQAILDGSFAKGFDEYYTDQFVKRDMFIEVNNFISDILTKNKFGDDEMVIVDMGGKDDFAGQSIE